MKSKTVSPYFCPRGIVAALAMGALLLPVVGAADDGSHTATVDQLVQEVLRANPELRYYQAEIAVARGELRSARTWSNPQLSAELGRKDVEDLDGHHLGDGASWSLSLAQTFEFPGRLGLRKAIANRQLELAKLGLEQFRTALELRARALAYHLLAAQQRRHAADEVSARFRSLLAVLLQRDPAGVAPLLETRIIEASALTIGRRAAEAAIALRDAQLELNQLRGAPAAAALAVVPAPLRLDQAPPLEQLLASARERNFEVRARIAELEQQGLRVRLSRNERWPAVTVAPYFRQENGVEEERQVGLGVTVPLPVFDLNRGNTEAASAREAQAEVALSAALRELERKLAAAHNAYGILCAEIARWPSDALQRFQEAARLGDQHFRLGALPIATYTTLQAQYLDAIDTVLATQAEALQRRQELELLAGSPFQPAVVAGTPDPADDGASEPRR